MDETTSPPLPRAWLLRESTGQPHSAILRSTAVGQPVRVHTQEHRWFRRVRYD